MRTGLLFVVFSVTLFGQATSGLPAVFQRVFTTGDPTNTTNSGPALIAALAAMGDGTLIIPKGQYKISTFVTFTRRQMMWGDSPQGTKFICTINPCMAWADTSFGASNYGDAINRNFTLQGTGTTSSNKLIYIGGDPTSTITPAAAYGDNVNFEDVIMTNTGTAVTFGSNAYADGFTRWACFANNSCWNLDSGVTNSGEKMSITGSLLFNNVSNLMTPSGEEVEIENTSLDCGCTLIYGSSINYKLKNVHLESQTTTNSMIVQTFGGANFSIDGFSVTYDQNVGNVANGIFQFFGQGGAYSFRNGTVYSNQTADSFVYNGTTSSSTFNPTFTFDSLDGNGNALITKLVGNINSTNSIQIHTSGINMDFNSRFNNGATYGCDTSSAAVGSPLTICGPLKLDVLTVSTLPATCTAGQVSSVSDALAPTYLGTLTGGSSTYTPVTCKGSNTWVSY